MHADTARIVNEEHMRLFRGSQRMLLAAALAGAVSLLGAASALANFPLVSGQLSCTSQGQQLITWTVANSDTSGVGGNTMRIDAVSVSQGTVAGIFVGQVVQPQPLAGSSVTGTTTLTNATGMVTLTVTGHFFTAGGADTGLVDTESATVFLSLNCAPQTQTQTIAGHIYDCTGGTATTTEVPGGTLGAGGPQSVATQGNPLTPTQVVAGTYTMSAGSPSGYQLVVCGSTATVTSPSTATESVNVPSGGAGVGIFYVTKITPLGTPLGPGMTATIGFWHNQNGQALIDSLNGGPNSTALGTWLATNFPNLFGGSCANLAGKTNAQVAAAFLVDFNLHGSAKQDTAQFFAVALASYSTSTSLAGGNQAAAYGFTTSSAGSGAATFNVGTNGAAFGVPNNTTLTLMQLLQDANSLASNCGTSDAAAGVFDSINSIGDIS